MTRKLISLTTAAVLSLAGLVYLQAKEPGEHGPQDGPGPHHMMMENPLEHLSKDLNLTDDQKAKVQPIVDQANPQIAAIH
jgi:Spy/CpxP family protein refolding chaperone